MEGRMGAAKGFFESWAGRTAVWIGTAQAFWLAVAIVAIWLAVGPAVRYSDTWQLVIDTVTSVVTFFIVFLIQYSQNRDTKAIHLKLDELIRAVREARTQLVGLENLSDEELERLQKQFQRIRQRADKKAE